MLTLFFFAQADVPPAPGYVESCTVAKHGKDTCKSCSAWHGGREECEELEAAGYHRVCKTRGASVWNEVMCGGSGTPGLVPPTPNKTPVQEPPAPPPSESAPAEPPPAEPAPAEPPPAKESSRCETGTSWNLWTLVARR